MSSILSFAVAMLSPSVRSLYFLKALSSSSCCTFSKPSSSAGSPSSSFNFPCSS